MGVHTVKRMVRQCVSKKKHRNENSARGAVNSMWKQHRVRGDYYYCNYCGGYHTFKKVEKEK